MNVHLLPNPNSASVIPVAESDVDHRSSQPLEKIFFFSFYNLHFSSIWCISIVIACLTKYVFISVHQNVLDSFCQIHIYCCTLDTQSCVTQ